MKKSTLFMNEAEQINSLEIKHKINRLGGYGSHGQVIYTDHTTGCPSVVPC